MLPGESILRSYNVSFKISGFCELKVITAILPLDIRLEAEDIHILEELGWEYKGRSLINGKHIFSIDEWN